MDFLLIFSSDHGGSLDLKFCLTNCLTNWDRYLLWLSLSLSHLIQDYPRVTKRDIKVTRDDPRVPQDYPRVTQDDSRLTKDYPRVTQDDPRVTKDDPWVTQHDPSVTPW